jgi:hypothetical protein
MATNTHILAAQAVPVKVREQVRKAENYIKIDGGVFRFCILPRDLNVLLIWAEAALEQAAQEMNAGATPSSTKTSDSAEEK